MRALLQNASTLASAQSSSRGLCCGLWLLPASGATPQEGPENGRSVRPATRPDRMSLLRLTLLLSLLLTTACSEIFGRGSPCGGTRQVDAQVVLPDTGLGAGGRANLSFYESEPGRSLDETSMILWTFPPDGTAFTDAPPRVRVVTDDGRVFLDRRAGSAYLGSWYVREPIPTGPRRDEIVSAFQQAIVTVEFLGASPAQKLTRVRPNVRFAGRSPILQCL